MGVGSFTPNANVIALHVDDVEQARSTLTEQRCGRSPGDTFDTGVCHMAFFADPDGNALMLHHRYAPRESQTVSSRTPCAAVRRRASRTSGWRRRRGRWPRTPSASSRRALTQNGQASSSPPPLGELLEHALERRAAVAGDADGVRPARPSRTASLVRNIATSRPRSSAAPATRKAIVTRSAVLEPGRQVDQHLCRPSRSCPLVGRSDRGSIARPSSLPSIAGARRRGAAGPSARRARRRRPPARPPARRRAGRGSARRGRRGAA